MPAISILVHTNTKNAPKKEINGYNSDQVSLHNGAE